MSRRSRRLPVVLTASEIDRLLAEARKAVDLAPTPKKKKAAQRDLLMIELGRLAGPRISELCKLRIEQIDLAGRTLSVLHGKGDKDRNLPIAAKLVPLLEVWIGARTSGWLFEGPGGDHLSPRTFQLRILALGRKAGLVKRVHPHLTRHSFATALLRSGADLKEVQQLLGHANLATTATYLHVEVGRLQSAVDRL